MRTSADVTTFLVAVATLVLMFWIARCVSNAAAARRAKKFADHMRGVGNVDGDWYGYVPGTLSKFSRKPAADGSGSGGDAGGCEGDGGC